MKKSSEKTEGERQKEKGLGKLMCVCAHKSSLKALFSLCGEIG